MVCYQMLPATTNIAALFEVLDSAPLLLALDMFGPEVSGSGSGLRHQRIRQNVEAAGG